MPVVLAPRDHRKPLGQIMVRNSIFPGSFVYTGGQPEYCTWEKGSILENNVISTAATLNGVVRRPEGLPDSDLYGEVCERRVHRLHDDPQQPDGGPERVEDRHEGRHVERGAR